MISVESSVYDLKVDLQAKSGIPVNDQILLCSSKPLRNDQSMFDVPYNSQLFLVLGLPGGVCAPEFLLLM